MLKCLDAKEKLKMETLGRCGQVVRLHFDNLGISFMLYFVIHLKKGAIVDKILLFGCSIFANNLNKILWIPNDQR